MALFVSAAMPAQSQSFFTSLGTDPATGVDRSSTSQFAKVDKPTRYLTFSTDGADAIGPTIGSISFSYPNAFADSDQSDLVFVLGGPSENSSPELTALGLGYRIDLPSLGATFFAQANHSDYQLGSSVLEPLDIEGEVRTAAVGLRWVSKTSMIKKRTWSIEAVHHTETATSLGFPALDEETNSIRLAVADEIGVPYGPRRRLSAALSKGIGGASSTLGRDPDFLRLSMSAEWSMPLPENYVVNAGIIGQLTDDSLPTSHRCGYATNTYARGFDRSYVTGDTCFGGRIELAYDIERPNPASGVISARQAFVGLDGGEIHNNANASTMSLNSKWSSLSVGLRVLKNNFIGDIAYTRILEDPGGLTEQDDDRLWVRLGFRF